MTTVVVAAAAAGDVSGQLYVGVAVPTSLEPRELVSARIEVQSRRGDLGN
jgi:hypothetical protein